MSVAGISEALPVPIAGLAGAVPLSSRLYWAVATLKVVNTVSALTLAWTRLRLWSETTFGLATWLQKPSVTGQFPLLAHLIRDGSFSRLTSVA